MVLTIVFAILIFSIIIFVHELGHFLAARAFKVKVLEFAIGMGPALFKRQKGETLYSIRAIPIGGFCSMEGEDSSEQSENSLSTKPWYAKIVILAAGATMNLILGFVVCLVMVTMSNAANGLPVPVVNSVLSEADASNFLQPNDRVIEIDGHRINIFRDLTYEIQSITSDTCDVTVKRDGKVISGTIKLYTKTNESGYTERLIGFNSKVEDLNVFNLIRESFFDTVWMLKMVFLSLHMLFSGKASVSDLSGPVGVVNTMSDVAKSTGALGFLFLSAFITVNIGIMNLLPLPALDGGRIFFVLAELITRRRIPPEKEGVVHFIGLVLLMALMVFVTWNDISRIFFKG